MNREAARTRLGEAYLETGVAEPVRGWHTSRNVVHTWVERYHGRRSGGTERPVAPSPPLPHPDRGQIEATVLEAKKATSYGRKRLAWYLGREKGLVLSPPTIRPILRRNGFRGHTTIRKTFYPAHPAWEEEKPFTLARWT